MATELAESETRQPFDLSQEMTQKIEELGIKSQLDHLRDEGYAIFENVSSPDFNFRLRETCIRLAQETTSKAKGHSASLLLGRDPIYEEVVLHPVIQALTEVMCGKGALLSQLITSIRPDKAPSIGLHADQNWLPAPFPKHNQIFTLCWAMDEFSETAGCTKVIPKSHLLKRHPNQQERENEKGAIPTICPENSIVAWDGSIWHSNYPRTMEGDRVVLHITFSRLALRTVENYDHLDEDWLEGKPEALSVMLGRHDFLGSTTIERGSADYKLIPRTFGWAKT